MTRDEIQAALKSLPTQRDPQRRLEHLGATCGQLFGWIAGPDQHWLVNWLPDVALQRAKDAEPMRIVEVGTFAGSTARGLISMTGGGTIACIDNFVDVHEGSRAGWPTAEDYWNAVMKGPPDLSSFARLLVGDSGSIGESWNEPIDLLLIDDDHAYEKALRSLRLYTRWLQPKGYCLVDDYDMPAVARACTEFFIGELGRWTFIRVPSEEGKGGKIFCAQRV